MTKLMGKPKPFPRNVAQKTFGVPVDTASTNNEAANEFGTILGKDIVMWRSGEHVNIAII